MKVTINDVARLARVSKSTVSRVLNKSGPVSPDTERLVKQAVSLLNYSPSLLGRSLATKKSYSIAVIVPDIRNPFFAHVCWKAERIMKENGYSAIICNTDNQTSEELTYLKLMKDRSVDGILLAGVVGDATNIINFKAREGIPVVLFDVSVTGYDIPTVTLDDIYGGYEITQYLISLGHRKIAFATSDVTYAERQRLEGYKIALRENGIPFDESLIIVNDESRWRAAECPELVELLNSRGRPTAIFCSNDIKAVRTYEILRESGLRVPEDISVTGYDDIDLARVISPPLTTMAQPIDEMVVVGTSMLISELKGEAIQERHKELKPKLVIRQSCAPPATVQTGIAGSVSFAATAGG
ncbi:MAG: LacI family DNA-binding transcriptional regulator [Firmicutes bacterium]|nr:LacI family DNA-binding transcriptional regulator [Bacillota bacterium]